MLIRTPFWRSRKVEFVGVVIDLVLIMLFALGINFVARLPKSIAASVIIYIVLGIISLFFFSLLSSAVNVKRFPTNDELCYVTKTAGITAAALQLVSIVLRIFFTWPGIGFIIFTFVYGIVIWWAFKENATGRM